MRVCLLRSDAGSRRSRPGSRPSSFRRPNLILVIALVGGCALSAQADGWRDEIGLTRLQGRLGQFMPTGGSIGVSQVELCTEGTDYVPDRRDACFTGKSITPRSGGGGLSNHATIVGEHYFGLGTSPAGDIRSADVYEANAWVNNCLRVDSPFEPLVERDRVQNHSWVGTLGSAETDTDALRRTDLMIERDGVLVAAGLNNGSTTSIPRLMCSAYNVVTVGLTNGNASRGSTAIDGPGRIKPDLVAPLAATSWATPVVAASGALLLEACEAKEVLLDLPARQKLTARALLVKGLLMGGATKSQWPDWRKGFATPCTDGSVPLDYRYGAGQLNIDNSHRILMAGRRRGSEFGDVPVTGWDLAPITAGGRRQYVFELPAGTRATEVSILVVWNRRVRATAGSSLHLTATLADIDLRLYALRESGSPRLVDASTSRVDNVEHIYLKALNPGRYAIDVRSDSASQYCLTWDAALTPTIQAHRDSTNKPVGTAPAHGTVIAGLD